jgi:hypothetical protein
MTTFAHAVSGLQLVTFQPSHTEPAASVMTCSKSSLAKYPVSACLASQPSAAAAYAG